jgi:SpoU rRNA methylase family enzyme
MLKSYEAIYDNGKLNWIGIKPNLNKVKVIVVVEEAETGAQQSIKQLKGIAPKPERVISLEEINEAIELEGAKH